MARGGHKYGAVKTDCGHCEKPHPSKAEAKRCHDLHMLERAGEITHLMREPEFPVIINGVKVFTYKADFSYFPAKPERGSRVVEDVKGVLTPIYRLKKKCVEASYAGVKIVEVK